MNELLQKIQRVLDSGQMSSEEEQQIDRLLWRTPMTKQSLSALKDLEYALVRGELSFK
ncbi:hypothetical protein [[Limnothrix rosea] IAM M-220]|uniref:hypothetical protein n=1 Tax=[Limnothrix rosea] IAM M-220 TaxID=454133 RepID=UPI0015C57043|nr:hypothetical protein [[Limnothrix rosea] IAM M-220]